MTDQDKDPAGSANEKAGEKALDVADDRLDAVTGGLVASGASAPLKEATTSIVRSMNEMRGITSGTDKTSTEK